jgi:rhodanese-related sulfurtransferase
MVSACAAQPTAAPVAPAATPVPPTAASQPALDLGAAVDKYLSALPEGFGTIKPDALNEQMAAAQPFILDVREASEITSAGTIEGAVNIPLRGLAKNLDKLPAKDQPIVTLCAIGHRGGMAMMTLQMLGYTNVKSLANGFNAWKGANLPVAAAAAAMPAAGTPPDVDKDLLAALDKYLSALPEGFGTIKPDALKEQMAAAKPFILDVREASEGLANGSIEGSVNIPIRSLAKSLDKLPADKAAPIVVYCAIGHRGGIGMMALQLLGYTNVKSLASGLTAWTAAGLPVVK